MARIRTISPEQWTDDRFVQMSAFARLLTIAIRNDCDDNGVFEWNPLKIKMRLFPADNVEIEALLAEMVSHNFVFRYESDGKAFGLLRNFSKYQRPKKPTFWHPVPARCPTGYALHARSSAPVANQSPTSGELPPSVSVSVTVDRSGDRRTGGEAEASSSLKQANRGARLLADWKPSPEDRAYAVSLGLTNVDRIAADFRDYWRAKPGKDGVKLDWPATWRTWCRREADRRGAKPVNGNHASLAPKRSPIEDGLARGVITQAEADAMRQRIAAREKGGSNAPPDPQPSLLGKASDKAS